MKLVTLFALLVTLPIHAVAVLDTTCKQNDCFKNGWTTTSAKGYSIDATCKNNNCMTHGWTSTDTYGSSFDVTCEGGSCFGKGWISVESDGKTKLTDFVECLNYDCLKHGSSSTSDYGTLGRTYCFDYDCARKGGAMYWRGAMWTTFCKSDDCYKYGWTTKIH